MPSGGGNGPTSWRQLSRADVKKFLESKGRMSVGVHSPKHIKRIPWPYCTRCGLLYLKNDVTQRAIAKPCVIEE